MCVLRNCEVHLSHFSLSMHTMHVQIHSTTKGNFDHRGGFVITEFDCTGNMEEHNCHNYAGA